MTMFNRYCPSTDFRILSYLSESPIAPGDNNGPPWRFYHSDSWTEFVIISFSFSRSYLFTNELMGGFSSWTMRSATE